MGEAREVKATGRKNGGHQRETTARPAMKSIVGPSRDLLALEAQERIASAFKALRDQDRPQAAQSVQGPPQREEIELDLTKRFLTLSQRLPESWLNDMRECAPDPDSCQDAHTARRSWSDPIEPASLFHLEPSAPTTTLEFQTAGLDGRVVGYKEVSRHAGPSLDSSNSTSLSRKPDDASSFIRGKSGHFPFAPGGIVTGLEANTDGNVVEELEKGLELAAGGIRTVPPGFERGLDFGEQRAFSLSCLRVRSTTTQCTVADDLENEAAADIQPIYRPTLAQSFEIVRWLSVV